MATKITTPELFNLSSNNTEATQLPVFTTSTRPTPTASTVTVDYLVVAGGGSGAVRHPGGGGAGGLRTSYGLSSGGGAVAESSLTLNVSTRYTVTIGAGGSSVTSDGVQQNRSGNNGTDSVFGTITSSGGGGGGAYNTNGFSGGSGGGGGETAGSSLSGGSGTTGQGYDGGGSVATYQGAGGGGGANQVGGSGQSLTAGNGGNGLELSINGTPTYYAGGGGGAGYNVGSNQGTGGLGGGGNGVLESGTPPNGAVNTGGGGGGNATGTPTSYTSGAGGSGIVILRYPTSSSLNIITTGSLVYTESTDGSDTVLQFTEGSGNFGFASAGIAIGEMIFNSTTGKVEYWDGFQWNMIKDEYQAGPGDIFQDGSNLFTSNFSNSTLSSLESGITYRSYGRSGGNYFIDNTIPVFRNDVPSGRSGFGKSLTLTDTGDDPTITIDGITPLSSVLTFSFWVYVVVHDDDDNNVLGVNLKRQNNGNMWVYIYEPNRSSYTYDSFSTLPTGSWQHMVVTKRSDNYVYTYKNNSLLGSINAGTKIPLPAGPFLGSANEMRLMSFSDADVSNEVWITGARIFNRGLTASEITTLYNENPTY
jgi:hypothetical protein